MSVVAIGPWDSTKESETAVAFASLLHTLEEVRFRCCQSSDFSPEVGKDISATGFNQSLGLHGSALHHAWHNLFVWLPEGSIFSRESEFILKF